MFIEKTNQVVFLCLAQALSTFLFGSVWGFMSDVYNRKVIRPPRHTCINYNRAKIWTWMFYAPTILQWLARLSSSAMLLDGGFRLRLWVRWCHYIHGCGTYHAKPSPTCSKLCLIQKLCCFSPVLMVHFWKFKDGIAACGSTRCGCCLKICRNTGVLL